MLERTTLLALLSCLALFFCACTDDDDDSGGAGPATDDDGAADDDDDDDDDNDDDDDDNDASPPPVDWRFIPDEQGRALILHGCNFSGEAKDETGLPHLTRNDALALGQVWGFNFARYLIFWARIEPEAGVYDEAYLDAVEERLDWLHEAGIKIVLDMHQDLWGPFITEAWSGSDGAPEWATITDGWPYWPVSQWLGNWGFDYLSPAVIRAFDNFWNYDGPHPELQDHYGAMWAHVAERFGGHPALLGYDLMNEPWQGSGLLQYKEFDETKFHAFNQRAINAIRAVDADHWIFYEPCAFIANQAGPSFLPVLDDPRAGENRLAYFPHFYPLLVDMLGGYRPEIDHSIDRWAELRLQESEKQQAPLLAGEWSMLRWFDDENRALFLDETLRMLESATSGWAYWECSGFFGDANDEFRRLLTSVYPRRVAGAPVSYGFDEQTRVFELVFEDRPDITGPTEIYLPEARDYPNGWGLLVSDPAGTWDSSWNAETQTLEIEIDSGEPLHTIRIVPEDGK